MLREWWMQWFQAKVGNNQMNKYVVIQATDGGIKQFWVQILILLLNSRMPMGKTLHLPETPFISSVKGD